MSSVPIRWDLNRLFHFGRAVALISGLDYSILSPLIQLHFQLHGLVNIKCIVLVHVEIKATAFQALLTIQGYDLPRLESATHPNDPCNLTRVPIHALLSDLHTPSPRLMAVNDHRENQGNQERAEWNSHSYPPHLSS